MYKEDIKNEKIRNAKLDMRIEIRIELRHHFTKYQDYLNQVNFRGNGDFVKALKGYQNRAKLAWAWYKIIINRDLIQYDADEALKQAEKAMVDYVGYKQALFLVRGI